MRARFLILSILILATGGIDARSTPLPNPKPAEKKERPKTVKFAMKDKPWKAIFEWLSETTGKPVISSYMPTGTLTFEGPPDKEYTIREVLDILDYALMNNGMAQKYYLLQRERSFTLIPADEQTNPSWLPRVKYEKLVDYGRYETVTVVLPLAMLDAKRMAPIAKLMGPKGDVFPLTSGGYNYLILIDRVPTLRRIGLFLLVLDTVLDPVSHFPRLQR